METEYEKKRKTVYKYFQADSLSFKGCIVSVRFARNEFETIIIVSINCILEHNMNHLRFVEEIKR